MNNLTNFLTPKLWGELTEQIRKFGGKPKTMALDQHLIIKCSQCQKVILQCGCIAINKPIEYRICKDCTNKENLK